MRRVREGQCPVRRPVFLRLNGVAHGRFEVSKNIPVEFKVGLFSEPKTYPAWVRYSCDIPDGVPERGETVGVKELKLSRLWLIIRGLRQTNVVLGRCSAWSE